MPAARSRSPLPEVKLLVLTMHGEQYFVTEAFRAGVSGYVLKQSVAEELVFAIKEVLKGRLYVSPSVAENLVEQALNPAAPGPARATATNDQLSARQREVLQLIAEGQSTKEIASTLNVSIKTVEFHKTRIMKQLGVHSTAELTKHAITIGLIAMPQQPTVPGPHV
jgi:DNA-binding NarL/FixJ family response regulator